MIKKQKMGFYEKWLKRPLDFIFAFLGLVLLSPVLIITSILIRKKLGRPVIFKQHRPGYQEKIFTMYKFRTMTDAEDKNGKLLPDEQRLTSFGKKLRASSLDELPELINILKGDMSIVGPRPLLIEYLPLYSTEQRKRHTVRPGLTGHAQVNGRNAITWKEKFALDLEYINNITFLGDCKIIIQTIKKVILKEDITSDTSVTMEAFTGNKEDV